MGPSGPKGDTGPQGVQGPPGPPGPNIPLTYSVTAGPYSVSPDSRTTGGSGCPGAPPGNGEVTGGGYIVEDSFEFMIPNSSTRSGIESEEAWEVTMLNTDPVNEHFFSVVVERISSTS